MASSLEELLAEEGFRRRRRSRMAARASFRADVLIKYRDPSRDKAKTDSPLVRKTKTERTKSDVARYSLGGESSRSDSSSSRRARDNMVSGEKIEGRSKIEHWKRLGHVNTSDVQQNNMLNSEENEEGEITEIGGEEDEGVKDVYSDRAYNSERSERSSRAHGEYCRHMARRGNNSLLDERQISNPNKYVYTSSSNSNEKSIIPPNLSHDSSVRGSKSVENFKGDKKKQFKSASQAGSNLALDEVAVKAVVSILSGYIKRFVKDEEFRIMLRDNCLSSLNVIENEEAENITSKVTSNLEQAIKIVEKAAEEAASRTELKRAMMQLCAITSLNLNGLKHRHMIGISNSDASACAHLYLSVIYKMEKKDRASARYLLQVFCDSPYLARTILLPELWDYLFFPHLSHLKQWYKQEADSVPSTPSKQRKLKVLGKVYDEILDSGTYQFAVYYQDWLSEGVEGPSPPSIQIPKMLVQQVEEPNRKDRFLGRSETSAPFSPRPMVSKKLYEAVSSHSSKHGSYEAEDVGEVENLDNGATTSDSSAYEVKQTIMCLTEISTHLNQDEENCSFKDAQDEACHSDNSLVSAKEEWKLVKLSPPDSGNITVSTISPYSKTANTMASYEEIDGAYEYIDEGSFLESVPEDFICPLSGQLFEDPVTLETGQTFERESIREWFDKGNRTCPVTAKTLERPDIPSTNLILKRIIDSWKLEYCSQLLALASQIVTNLGKQEPRQMDNNAVDILEKLLTSFSREERLTNAKHLISFGGLEFLIRRITSGDSEEKIRIAALLSCCIEADPSCRNHIIKRVDKYSLFKLLHSKQPKSRRNAVHLLTELLCLSRRKDVKSFLSGLQKEVLTNTMHILLMYLRNSQPEERPRIAVLLLHIDLLVEHHKLSIYREQAVDAITVALECSLTDQNVCEKACLALAVLGGRFSASGKPLTESWLLKQAGLNILCDVDSQEEDFSLKDEEKAIDEWLTKLSESLLGSGKKSFLETISKCLASENLDLVKACLTTIAWLSYALSALSDADFLIYAFSALIYGLKESLENSVRIELKVLASISLLNFSHIPECKVLLMTIAEEIAAPLQSLVEVTWTAKQLHAIISGDYH